MVAMVTKIRFCFGSNRLPFTQLLLPTMIYHPVQGQGKRPYYAKFMTANWIQPPPEMSMWYFAITLPKV